MLRHAETLSLLGKVLGPYTSGFIAHDVWRLENSFFGLQSGPEFHDGTALFLGVRSGLEVLRLQERMPGVSIVIVEPNEILRREVMASFNLLSKNNVHIFATLDEGLQKRTKIDYVRVEAEMFDWDVVKNLLLQHDIAHICGEFKLYDADPLDVIRFSRVNAESFFWRMPDLEIPLHGKGEVSEVEVSVVIPCYKVANWIDKCLESLAFQTIKSLEIIAVDDGSPDITGEKLDDWAKRFPGRIKVIHKPNGGCASARNAGLMAARGEYVGFVDGDDWVEPAMFEELYRSATLYSADISICGYTEVYEETGTKKDISKVWPYKKPGLVENPRDYLGVQPTIWRKLYRRDFLASNALIFPNHVKRFDDLPFNFESISRAKRVSVVPECYYNYRLERPGQDVSATDAKIFVHFKIFEWLDEKILPWADANLERALFVTKLHTHLWALTRIGKGYSGRYKRLAAHDIFDHRWYLSFPRMFRIALKNGGRTGLFLLLLWFYSKMKKPEMIPCD